LFAVKPTTLPHATVSFEQVTSGGVAA